MENVGARTSLVRGRASVCAAYSYFFELGWHALAIFSTNRHSTRLVVRPTNVGET